MKGTVTEMPSLLERHSSFVMRRFGAVYAGNENEADENQGDSDHG
jgi:hypothetical protein